MRRLLLLLALLCALCGAERAAAQYYTWGSDPPQKWSAIRTPDVRMIYPDTVAGIARRTLFYIRSVRPDIGYGFRHGPMRIPFVMHPENFQSNGLVMYLPKRVEFLTSPAVDSYSMPWYKQLVAHEYRHAVQYNNLDRGVIRALSYVLGQQGSTIGLLCMPIWAMEGDAVMSETMHSSFGRGLQPSFSMAYRAMGSVGRDRRNIDRWFCGSYRDYIPDHYELGYQICSYAWERYGENIWDKVAWYGSRNPYVLATTRVALGKFYKTNVIKLFRETFDELERYWDSLPETGDSAVPLTALPEKNHTTYQWPLPLGDTAVVALKTDLDRVSRFVVIDRRTGGERTVCHTGLVSTRPSMADGRVWWTEYRRSTLFEQRVNSQLCYMDLADGVPRTAERQRNALYPTASGEEFGWVEYNPDGRYTVVVRHGEGPERRFETPVRSEIHGLAWDDRTVAWYVLVTDDSGMWIGRIDSDGLHPITEGAYITLSNLRAGGGKLYYGSIASGRDEAHCFDLGEGREYRLSTSTYGSFAPAPADSGAVWTTTYDRKGYRITRQENIEPIPVAPSQLPVDLVNPPRRRWNVVNLDTVRYTPADSASLHRKYPARRYRKGLHLLRAHSWAPVSFDPFKTIEEFNPRLMWGATVLSQNLLSSTEAFASWGWSRADGHVLKGTIRYSGLGVRLEARATYGGDRMTYGIAQRGADGKAERQPAPAHAKYWSAAAGATLPLYFDRGRHIRQLSLSAGWEYSNGMVADVDAIRYDAEGRIANLQTLGYREGLHKLSLGIGFSDVVRAAYRDVGTPWGYTLWAGYDLNPENRNFSDLVSAYARIYTPGFFRHNSLSVAAAYQTSVGGYRFPSGLRFLGYKSTRLLPRGFSSSDISSNNYLAGSVDYQFPLCYPEGGISGVIYFKRIRLNVGADYARFQEFGSRGKTWRDIYSYGGDLLLDLNILRMSAAATATVKLSLYKPSEGSCWFGFGLELPF